MLKNLMLALSFGALMFITYKVATHEPAPVIAEPAPEKIWDSNLEIPPGVKLVNIECGAPCLLYWDPLEEQYVAAFANGGVIYFSLPQ